jgi:arylsulfate sulfotransferase
MLRLERSITFAVFVLVAWFFSGQADAMSVSLNPSIPPPAPVGTIVTWTAAVSDAGSGPIWYRFRSRLLGADFSVIRDYGPAASLDWTASEREGVYEIEVSARNVSTGDSDTISATYEMTSRVTNGVPVINPTANPLVFLYSAPPCPVGESMSVHFQTTAGVANTPEKACQDGVSMNFYLAGMAPGSSYWVQHMVLSAYTAQFGPVLHLAVPAVSLQIPNYNVLQPLQLPTNEGILLQATLGGTTVATDLSGNLIWFYPQLITVLTRPDPGGLFFAIVENPGVDQSMQIVREFDLAGTTIRETNAARVNEQLAALGKRQISAFHHEARSLPGGGMLVLASVEQILTDVQGPGPVDVIGDMIIVLDQDLQVVWTWDAFDHLDTSRMATLGEVCVSQGAGCPPYYLAPTANDWLHGNDVQLTPDGNLLYSTRHQDWLIKIDYNSGNGPGDIIWRLGMDGDFAIQSSDPNPWFSHQHDAQFEFLDNETIALFDNGDVRYAADPTAHSRGQVILLDETARVATPILNADLGAYSFALGSAQKLSDGNFHFNLGVLPDGTSQSVEVDSFGNKVYDLSISLPDYRSFRMRDLYSPPQ